MSHKHPEGPHGLGAVADAYLPHSVLGFLSMQPACDKNNHAVSRLLAWLPRTRGAVSVISLRPSSLEGPKSVSPPGTYRGTRSQHIRASGSATMVLES